MKLPYLTDYIFIDRGILDLNFCRDLLHTNSEKDSTWENHTWTYKDSDNQLMHESRTKEELIVKYPHMHGDSAAEKLSTYMNTSLQKYYTKMTDKICPPGHGAFLCSQVSSPRINRYPTGTNMASHHDSIISLFEKGTGVPVLSIVGLLNDDFEGGEFMMFDSMKLDLRAGDILIFPSAFMYRHSVKTVTNGERWSFVSWAI